MNIFIYMSNLIDEQRTSQIIEFLNSLDIKSDRFVEVINKKDETIIINFHEALTHSSSDNINNYEKLEFFGDAVLRLSASDFIERNYSFFSVGKRSELRSQIVSDEWLTKLGKKIFIDKFVVKGLKASNDKNSQDTIIAETTEAVIGALYKTFNSIEEVNLLLDKYWRIDAELFLKEPYKFNAKSALQEWCQQKGLDLSLIHI